MGFVFFPLSVLFSCLLSVCGYLVCEKEPSFFPFLSRSHHCCCALTLIDHLIPPWLLVLLLGLGFFSITFVFVYILILLPTFLVRYRFVCFFFFSIRSFFLVTVCECVFVCMCGVTCGVTIPQEVFPGEGASAGFPAHVSRSAGLGRA